MIEILLQFGFNCCSMAPSFLPVCIAFEEATLSVLVLRMKKYGSYLCVRVMNMNVMYDKGHSSLRKCYPVTFHIGRKTRRQLLFFS